jgi:hypothetical protein
MRCLSIALLVIVVGVAGMRDCPAQEDVEKPAHARFLPPPLRDAWTRWLVGRWEGIGTSDAGRGRGTVTVELAVNGQFLIQRGEAEITEIAPEQRQYLKKYAHATDEEIDRFGSLPFRSLEVFTVDQKTGEYVGYLFDSLRCVASGRGKLEGNRLVMEWKWSTGHTSTRITERLGDDKLKMVERIRMPDGTFMEEGGEMTRVKE